MAICVPKHIVCDWYTPTFIAGTTPCTLTVFNETRARLTAGNSFFRSIAVGISNNNIQISSEWQVFDGTPPTWRAYNSGTDTILDVGRVKLTVTSGTTTETYFATQTAALTGSPEITPDWVVSGIPSLRTQLSASVLATMPLIDNCGTLTPGTVCWDQSTDEGNHLAEFALTNLTGGSGGPEDQAGRDAIRTGPAQTLIFINNSEINNADGISSELRETRYWNGYCWKEYNPSIPDCEDPNSPPSCVGGPEGDC